MSDAAVCLTVLAAVVVLFVWNRLPVEAVAFGSALVLYATGVLDAGEVFAGFGDPVVTFVAALFVVSAALQATGLTAWAGRRLTGRGGGPARLVVLAMLPAAGLTALITVTGAVAALLPLVVMLATRAGLPPSRLVLPLVYAGHAGSLLLLIGSPINVIASEAAAESGGHPFGFFDFTVVGLPVLAGTVGLTVLFGHRLLPRRTPSCIPSDLSRHARTLIAHYGLEQGAASLQVPAGSGAVGLAAEELTAGAPPGLAVVGALTADGHDPRGDDALQTGDILIVRGERAATEEFAAAYGLGHLPAPLREHLADVLVNRDSGLVEVVVSPRSTLIGERVFPGMATADGDLVILAVHRSGQEAGPGRAVLRAGDTLLVQGGWQALDRGLEPAADVLVVDSAAEVKAQLAPPGAAAWRALAVLAGMVLLLATGAVPAAVAGLLAALAVVLLRVLTPDQAYQGISWTTVVIVGGLFPLSVAIQRSGAADDIAHLVVRAAGGNGYLLLLGVFLLTAVLGQFVSNMATALIVVPIAVSAAQDAGVSVQPLLMCVAVAAAAAVLTPVATPANMMVMGAGGYRFGDYWRYGLPVLGWFLVVTLTVVPLVWRF
ncbi:SLC13 family permease [Streptomyces sp. CB03911]|uniref:SLC13 family permease n=1 Tax=Streptomycetaceae TaxID=2062 RepID=UPI0009393CEE|nr:SLC13 family permease [Streptomyces sp. CB03911]OKI28834.1 citrate transporter [Streptomyces sp. CB03911]